MTTLGDKLKNLIETTTAYKMVDAENNLVSGVETFPTWEDYPQQLRFREQSDFNCLKSEWEKIWGSFGGIWNTERQLFRYFWSECRDFFQSYKLYKRDFEEFVPLGFEESAESKERMGELIQNCELHLRSIYENGKQAIDILEKISPYIQKVKLFTPVEELFSNKFSETRNKFLTHYHNPKQYNEFFFDPVYFSIMGTGSSFEIRIHIPDEKESIYTLFVNHRHDYFTLETIFIRVIKHISNIKSNTHIPDR